MAKRSTYARLLKPGQRWYVKGEYKGYTVNRVEIPHETLVKVFVDERVKPFLFDDIDRVELI